MNLDEHITALVDRRVREILQEQGFSAPSAATLRVRAGLSPAELAGVAGVCIETVWRVERGQWDNPSRMERTFAKLALGCRCGLEQYREAALVSRRQGGYVRAERMEEQERRATA